MLNDQTKLRTAGFMVLGTGINFTSKETEENYKKQLRELPM